jgi:hypothetical protein
MDFDDDNFDSDAFSEEESRKKEDAKNNHPLAKQGKEILEIVNLLLDCIEDKNERELYGSTLLESSHMINAKLAGAIGSDSYIVCMQHAAIIRYHAEYIRLSNHSLNEMEGLDKKYISVLRAEMETFRELFRKWVIEIKNGRDPDDLPDEWGLF